MRPHEVKSTVLIVWVELFCIDDLYRERLIRLTSLLVRLVENDGPVLRLDYVDEAFALQPALRGVLDPSLDARAIFAASDVDDAAVIDLDLRGVQVVGEVLRHLRVARPSLVESIQHLCKYGIEQLYTQGLVPILYKDASGVAE